VRTGLTFDDVLLVPRRSSIRSRQDVSLQTQLTRNHSIAMPILAANMDTVCELDMALALARLGGCGVIHRFLPTENQSAMVAAIKADNAETPVWMFWCSISLMAMQTTPSSRCRSSRGSSPTLM